MAAAFETAEYRERIAKVSAEMERQGLETLVLFQESHMGYLTGYDGYSDYVPQCAVLRAGDTKTTLVLREMDIHCAYPTIDPAVTVVDHYPESCIGTPDRSPWDVIGARILEIAGKGAIGFEFGAATYNFGYHNALVKALQGRAMSNGSSVMPRVKIRKSAAELDCMRKAASIVDRALQNGLAMVAEGVRQCDVAARVHHDLVEGTGGVGGGPHKALTMPTGPGVAQAPHLKWTDAPFRRGDQTDFEAGATVHRYTVGLSRTSIVGTPTDRLKRADAAARAGFEAALGAVKPGARCCDVHAAFKAAFEPHGFRKESRIGYSIGLDWGDLCFSLQADDTTVLEPGFTMHIIVGIWEPEDAYVFSETVEVRDDKGHSLANTPRKLFVC